MSKRLDDDEHNAMANLHIIEALLDENREAAKSHLAQAHKHVRIVLNRGKDANHPDYVHEPQAVVPPHGGMGADE